jgi:hypothetical protein
VSPAKEQGPESGGNGRRDTSTVSTLTSGRAVGGDVSDETRSRGELRATAAFRSLIRAPMRRGREVS